MSWRGSAATGALCAVFVTTSAFAHLGQPENYRWVEPPPEFADTNLPPAARQGELIRSPGPTSVWTDDLQAIVVVPEPVFDGAETVWIEIDPVAPSTQPPLPPGREATGNAYRIGIYDGEGGTPLPIADSGIELVLSVPHEPTAILRLEAGRWIAGSVEPAVPQGFATPLTSTGTFVAVTTHDEDGRTGWLVVGGATAALFTALAALGARRHRMASTLRS